MVEHNIRDLDFVIKLFDGFFSQKRIQKRLDVIDNRHITGWEIWFQIEFATYLDMKEESISEWYREYPYSTDKRKTSQKKMFIDFLVRQKYAKKDSFVALELKQNISGKKCVNNMIKDINKVISMRKSESDIRSFWNVGVYLEHIDEDEIKNILEPYINNKYMKIKQIKNTNFSYIIF